MKAYHRVLLCCFVAWLCCEVVECHGDLLDGDGKILKEEHLANEGRPENGVIKATNIHEDLLMKSNKGVILHDTGDKNAIKISDQECESEFPKCTDTGGSCDSKVVGENKTTQCVCPGKSVHEEYKGCTVPDDVCKTDFPKCAATGGNCNVKVEEEREKPAVQCECPDKSVYEASEGCTVPEEMCKTYFSKCMETGGKCNVEVGNEEAQSVVHCECPEIKGYNKGVGCKACDCGINAASCNFVGDFKTCMCLPNNAEKEGKCVDCECGMNSTGCKFNRNDIKICKCNENFFQRGKECVVSDKVCESDFPNCTTTGGYCNVENEEKSKKSAVQCLCPSKSLYDASEGCTVPEKLCKTAFPKCMDTGGKCYVDSLVAEAHCGCPEMKGYNEGAGCKACDCGISASGCSFAGNFQFCTCLPNSSLKEYKCVDCECGMNSTGCVFTSGGKKVCLCNDMFAQKGLKCVDCDCGVGSIDCTFNKYGVKKCSCRYKYGQKGDKCEECDCGPKSFSCKFVNDKKTCGCYVDYGQKDGVCTECDCGPPSYGCKFEKAEKKCDCFFGYGQKDGKCIEGIEEQSGLSASAIVGIVGSVVVGILLLAAAVLYYLKYYKKSPFNRNIPDHRISSENTIYETGSSNKKF